jgi:hypothetical protein
VPRVHTYALQVRVLEAERLAALQTAATARQEVCELQEARRRLEWQSQLMEKMSKVSRLGHLASVRMDRCCKPPYVTIESHQHMRCLLILAASASVFVQQEWP